MHNLWNEVNINYLHELIQHLFFVIWRYITKNKCWIQFADGLTAYDPALICWVSVQIQISAGSSAH